MTYIKIGSKITHTNTCTPQIDYRMWGCYRWLRGSFLHSQDIFHIISHLHTHTHTHKYPWNTIFTHTHTHTNKHAHTNTHVHSLTLTHLTHTHTDKHTHTNITLIYDPLQSRNICNPKNIHYSFPKKQMHFVLREK